MPFPDKLLPLCPLVLALALVTTCSAPPAPPAGEDQGPVPQDVEYEIDGENLRIRSKVDGVRVVETSPEARTVFSLEEGDSRLFPIHSRIEVYGHLMTFDCEPDPSKCPTPKPIPSAGFQLGGTAAACFCLGTPSQEICANPPDECLRRCCGQ